MKNWLSRAIDFLKASLESPWLYEQMDAIEPDFGEPMEWLLLNDKKAAGIRYRKEFDGYDSEHWPEMIEWLTKHVKRLKKAFGGFLKPLGHRLKAEFNSKKERFRRRLRGELCNRFKLAADGEAFR